MAWDVPTTATVGQVLTAAFWNAEVKGNMDYLKGGIGSYTPQVDQGVTNIGKTITEARYTKAGDMVDLWVQLAITGTGTAGSSMSVTVPVSMTGHISQSVIGHGYLQDTSVQTYGVSVCVNAATSVVFRPHAITGYFGSAPSVAITNTDIVAFVARYHAA